MRAAVAFVAGALFGAAVTLAGSFLAVGHDAEVYE